MKKQPNVNLSRPTTNFSGFMGYVTGSGGVASIAPCWSCLSYSLLSNNYCQSRHVKIPRLSPFKMDIKHHLNNLNNKNLILSIYIRVVLLLLLNQSLNWTHMNSHFSENKIKISGQMCRFLDIYCPNSLG
jgi:hypothetical protein